MTEYTNYLNHIYDAAGNKLGKYTNGHLRSYLDGIESIEDKIDIIHTEEGVSRNNNGTYSYEYNLSDHLGNVRASFYQNPGTRQIEVIQRDDYSSVVYNFNCIHELSRLIPASVIMLSD